MTDRRRDEQWSSGAGSEPTQQFGYGPTGGSTGGPTGSPNVGPAGYPDPAYASQTQYGPPYQPPATRPTERLTAYGYDPSTSGFGPPGFGPPGFGPPGFGPPGFGPQHQPGQDDDPDGPRAPRWLWIVTGVAVLTVVGLVVALVVVNSSRQHTVMAPLPSAPEPELSTPTPTPRPPTTTSRTPTTPLLPLPTLPSVPSATSPTETPGATDSVIYIVEGSGRVINITYVDSGGLLQTEFNVLLPWSKLVSLPKPAEGSASISIINVGRELTCSITVNGIEVEQRTGVGLTICAAPG